MRTTSVGADRSPGTSRSAKAACNSPGNTCASQVDVGGPTLSAIGETSTLTARKCAPGESGALAAAAAVRQAMPKPMAAPRGNFAQSMKNLAVAHPPQERAHKG